MGDLRKGRMAGLWVWPVLLLVCAGASAQEANSVAGYIMPLGVQSRWTSPENPSGRLGEGGKANDGAKGHAYDDIPVHGHVDLLNVKGAGRVDRIKLTVNDRSPKILRTLRIAMYWDGARKAAVSAPLGDFFGVAFGHTASYDNAYFNDPEGRSFAVTIPMPYKTGARIVIYNDSDQRVTHLYYNVNYEEWSRAPERMMYFHAYWHQNDPPVGQDFQILPEVHGAGRFMGVTLGVRANPVYGGHKQGQKVLYHWFGEGEVKIYLGSNATYPTMVGTGLEDYFGSAWGMGQFVNRFDGCPIASPEADLWSCYRYHVPDPVYFHRGIKVTVQQLGGGPRDQVRKIEASGAPMKVISVDTPQKFYPLLTMKDAPKLDSSDFPQGWVNYYRSDLWSAVAYFYLDTPTDNLPPIAPLAERLQGISSWLGKK